METLQTSLQLVGANLCSNSWDIIISEHGFPAPIEASYLKRSKLPHRQVQRALDPRCLCQSLVCHNVTHGSGPPNP
jgi:hypothetical protein